MVWQREVIPTGYITGARASISGKICVHDPNALSRFRVEVPISPKTGRSNLRLASMLRRNAICDIGMERS